MTRLLSMLIGGVLCSSIPSQAQLFAPNEAGVSAGHLRVVTRDIDATRKMLVSLGGRIVRIGESQDVMFPGILILFQKAEPTGPSVGSVVNHIGFLVYSVPESVAKWKADGLNVEPGANNRPDQAYVTTPDGVRIEILEDKASTVPIHYYHAHVFVPEASIPEIQAWYIKTLGARAAKSVTGAAAADIPGERMIFAKADSATVGTKGRALDSIGFEVRNLESLCKKLQASGVKLDRPYSKNAMGIHTAYITDPWGTQIELTEGLIKVTAGL